MQSLVPDQYDKVKGSSYEAIHPFGGIRLFTLFMDASHQNYSCDQQFRVLRHCSIDHTLRSSTTVAEADDIQMHGDYQIVLQYQCF